MGESTIMMMSNTKVTSANGTTLILSVSLISSEPCISIVYLLLFVIPQTARGMIPQGSFCGVAGGASVRQENEFLGEQAHAVQSFLHPNVEIVVNQRRHNGDEDTAGRRNEGFRDTG